MAVMYDGLPTIMSFDLNPLIGLILQKTVQPTGFEDRGMIDMTAMENQTYVTQMPKKLKKLSNGVVKAFYEGPTALAALGAMVQKNQLITTTFPGGGTFSFYGAIVSAVPDEHQEGVPPMITITVSPTMINTNCDEIDYSWSSSNNVCVA